MYCNNNFKGKYGATVGLKLSKPPGKQDYRGTTVVSCHIRGWVQKFPA